jgi:hypothetical protein
VKPTWIKLKKLLTYSLLSFLLLSSCEQDAYFTVPDGNSKLYAFSEISTGSKIKVDVNIAPGINTDDNFNFPKQSDAQVTLFKDGIPLDDPAFRYITGEKAFISQGAFTPEAGVEYSLEISLKNSGGIKPIFGSTIIPDAEDLEDIKILNFQEIQTSPTLKDFSLDIEIDFSGITSPYFIIKPYFLNVDGDRNFLVVQDIIEGSKGARSSRFDKGILIDRRKLDRKLKVRLTNEDLVDLDLQVYDNIYFEVKTITDHAHSYYKAFTRQLNGESAVVAEPAISYTNFENGLGLFTGYASSITKLKF